MIKLSDMEWTGEVIQAINDEKIKKLLGMGFYTIDYAQNSVDCAIDLKDADIKPDEFTNYKYSHMGAEHRFYDYSTRRSRITIVVPWSYKGEERGKEILEMIFKDKGK